MPHALDKDVQALDLYNKLPDSSSDRSTSSSSSSERCSGKPKQPVEVEENPLQKQSTLLPARANPKGSKRERVPDSASRAVSRAARSRAPEGGRRGWVA